MSETRERARLRPNPAVEFARHSLWGFHSWWRGILRRMRRVAYQTLWFDSLRSAVGRARLHYFVRIRRQFRTMDSEQAYATTVAHNLRGLTDHVTKRMQRLIQPLISIETLNTGSRILVIGPRTESDLLMFRALGFDDVRGLDLISYSPWVDLGDMHGMPYADSTWDAVILAWCLTYSREPEVVAREVIRVAKPGALIGVGLEYSTLTPDDVRALIGYEITTEDGPPRANSVGDVLSLFGSSVDHVYFDHDAPRRRTHTRSGEIPDVSQVVVVFSIRKD